MRKIIALLLVLLMLMSLAACKGGENENSVNRPDETEVSVTSERPVKDKPVKEKPEKEVSEAENSEDAENNTKRPGKETLNKKPSVLDKINNALENKDPEPSQGLDAYEFPADHPHEGKDLTVFDGTYHSEYPHNEDDETWVEVTGFNDFILLEFYGLMEGSVYRFWAEEFWPEDGWYTDKDDEYVSGKSQSFSSMAQYENYSELPQKRGIGLTDKGILLDWGANEAEHFIRDDGFVGGHSSAEELRTVLGDEVHLNFDYQYDSRNAVGNWATWNSDEAVNLVLSEDGSFKMFLKTMGQPIEVYEGAYGFGENSGNLVIAAERAGFDMYPYTADWEWYIDEYGFINLTDHEGSIFEGELCLWPVEEEFFTAMTSDTAMGYMVETVHADGEYTDQYGTDYIYYFSIPEFIDSDNKKLEEINDSIYELYFPIIDSEMNAMDAGEVLAYDYVDWELEAYNGVLFLHVFAFTYDWEEHSIFYIDTDTLEPMGTEEMLKRIGLSEKEFLDTVRVRAEEVFIETFSEIPEEEREAYGYYDCLEQTVSDAFVNLDLPVFVDRYGDIRVYLKLSSMAGSGVMWVPDYPFGMTMDGEGIG